MHIEKITMLILVFCAVMFGFLAGLLFEHYRIIDMAVEYCGR